MASIDVGRLTEDEARVILEGIRWPKGPVCPHCGSMKVTRIKAKSEKVRDGVIQCNDCRQQFSVTVKTIMHGSHITLRQWVQAFYSMCSHKKGVSALQLQRNLGLHSYNSAWYLAHRIRAAMGEKSSAFALLKCGVHGTFHHISKQHLKRYCDEFSFRWNYRKVNDGKRAEAAIKGADGKQLSYKMVALPNA
jgi:transposase-like protein